jgi:hypothetical protein
LLSLTQLDQVVVVGPVEWTVYILIPEGLPLRIQIYNSFTYIF